MHLLAAQPGVVSDGSEAVDLGQTPGDIVMLSAADTELACLAAARAGFGDDYPSLRLANLLQLSHNMSVDVYVDAVIAEAKLVIVRLLGGAGPWKSSDPDTERIWWDNIGVHQNLTHAVQPDPVSGAHCWLQKAVSVRKAKPGERYGDVWVDTHKSMEVYYRWLALARSAVDHSPDGTRRPYWIKRPLKPVREAFLLPEKPWGRD